MRILVNGRFVTQSLAGVQRYAHEVVNALSEITEVELLVPGGARKIGPIPSRIREVRMVGKRTGHLWEQLDLRLHLRERGYPLLLNLGNTAPVRYKNQIVAHHDISYVRFPRTYSWRFRAAYRLLAWQTLPYVRVIVTGSQFSKKEISNFFGITENRIHVVPDAPTKFRLSESAGQYGPFFLAVGSLLPHKNYETLLGAFQKFRDETQSDTRLIVVGGTVPAGPKCPTTDSDLAGVTFLGRVSDDELGSLYANAKAFVFPSKYEGFGLPPLEAQLTGCPVIAADTEVARETLKDSALYFRPPSTHELAKVLSTVDSDSVLRGQISLAGKENVQRYSWERTAAALRALLESVSMEN